VYYWASWGSRLAEEAKLLADLEKKFAGKLTIVTVNLDDKAETATQSITAAGLKGVHLYQPGGIDANPLAVSYGIMGPHLFLIGKDGKMANKNAQLPVLADEIEKMLK
jgi:thiol-disulfide isomerase/thioredoxin